MKEIEFYCSLISTVEEYLELQELFKSVCIEEYKRTLYEARRKAENEKGFDRNQTPC